VSDKNYTRTESRNGSESSFLGSSRFPCCGTAPCEDLRRRASSRGPQARVTSRAPPLRKDLSGSKPGGLMLPLPDRPQIGEQPRTKRVGHNPHLRLLSHSGCNHGYARLGYELPQLLLQLTLQLFDGEPSGVNTV
jgi:hypothetical protein